MKRLIHFRFLLFFLLYILIGTILLTISNLIFGLSNKANELVSLLYMSAYCIFFGIRNTKKISSNYLKSGFKYCLIHLGIIYLISSLLFGFGFNKERLLYYLIIIGLFILGTMIGIKLKKE